MKKIMFGAAIGLAVCGLWAGSSSGQSDLRGYWPLTDESGPFLDQSSYSNNGVASGDVTYRNVGAMTNPPRYPYAAGIEGHLDQIEVPHADHLNITNTITLAAWVKREKGSQIQTLITKGAYSLKINDDERPYLELCGPGESNIVDIGHAGMSLNPNAAPAEYTFSVYHGKLFSGGSIPKAAPVANWSAQIGRYEGTNMSVNATKTNWTQVGPIWTNRDHFSYGQFFSTLNKQFYVGTHARAAATPDLVSVFRFVDRGGSWTTGTNNWDNIGPLWTNATLSLFATGTNLMWSMAVYSNNLYVGNSSGAVLRLDVSNNTYAVVTNLGTNIYSVSVQQAGSFCTYNGKLVAWNGVDVYAYDGVGWTNCGHPLSTELPPTNQIFLSVYTGTLVAACVDKHVYQYLGSTNWTDLGIPDTNNVSRALITYNGKLYAPTFGKILRYVSVSNWVDINAYYTQTVPFVYASVTSLYGTVAVYDGRMIVGTSCGGDTLTPHVFAVGTGLAVYASTEVNDDGLFHHVAATYDGTTAKIYLDGQLVGSKIHQGLIIDTNDCKLLIGGGMGTGGHNSYASTRTGVPSRFGCSSGEEYFQGKICEVRVYDRALNIHDIRSLYDRLPRRGMVIQFPK